MPLGHHRAGSGTVKRYRRPSIRFHPQGTLTPSRSNVGATPSIASLKKTSYSACSGAMDTGMRRNGGSSWSIRTHLTGFQMPLVTSRGPQSHPKWYWALRLKTLFCSPTGRASLLTGIDNSDASSSDCPTPTGLRNTTSNVSWPVNPNSSVGRRQARCMLFVLSTVRPFTCSSACVSSPLNSRAHSPSAGGKGKGRR